MMSSVYADPESNPNYNRIVGLLEETIRFDGADRKINQRNYYVVKHRLTKYNQDIINNEIRAGYLFVLVRKVNDVAVSYFYAHDTQDVSNVPGTKRWASWNNPEEGWIIYDGDSGHIRGNLSGSLMD